MKRVNGSMQILKKEQKLKNIAIFFDLNFINTKLKNIKYEKFKLLLKTFYLED